MPTLSELLAESKVSEFRTRYYNLIPEQRAEELAAAYASGFNQLHLSAILGEAQAISLSSIDPNSVYSAVNRTPLHYAADCGALEVYFIDGSFCNPELFFANYQTCAHVLLNHGANPHLKDSKGKTVLQYAVDSASEFKLSAKMASEYVALLLDEGAGLGEDFSKCDSSLLSILDEKLNIEPPEIILIGANLSEELTRQAKQHMAIITNSKDFFKHYPNLEIGFLNEWLRRVSLALHTSSANAELQNFKTELAGRKALLNFVVQSPSIELLSKETLFNGLECCVARQIKVSCEEAEGIVESKASYSMLKKVLHEIIARKKEHVDEFLLSFVQAMIINAVKKDGFAKEMHTVSLCIPDVGSYQVPKIITEIYAIAFDVGKSTGDRLQEITRSAQAFYENFKSSPKMFALSNDSNTSVPEFCEEIGELLNECKVLHGQCLIQ
jgi:ankyrin repeat protein